MLTNQANGEFLKVVKAKKPVSLADARRLVEDWLLLLPIAPTTTEHLIAASELVERHRLQFWDSVILTVCAAAEIEYLLSEAMQDGATYGNVRVLNPFNPANAEIVDYLLTPLP